MQQLVCQILVTPSRRFPACVPPAAVQALQALCASALSCPLAWAVQSAVYTRSICLTAACAAVAKGSPLALPYVRLLVSAPPQPQHTHARSMAALLYRLGLLPVKDCGGDAAVMQALRVLLLHTGVFCSMLVGWQYLQGLTAGPQPAEVFVVL
jgi:hypothetical protein